MTTITSTKAEKSFGNLLDTAQREPVTIQREGRPVAVLVSKDEYDDLQRIKFEKLKADIAIGIEQVNRGETVPGGQVFDGLEKLSQAKRRRKNTDTGCKMQDVGC